MSSVRSSSVATFSRAVRHPGPPLVEPNESGERTQSLEELGPVGNLPAELEMGDRARRQDEVDRVVLAGHLVGDHHLTARRVPRVGSLHASTDLGGGLPAGTSTHKRVGVAAGIHHSCSDVQGTPASGEDYAIPTRRDYRGKRRRRQRGNRTTVAGPNRTAGDERAPPDGLEPPTPALGRLRSVH